MFPEIDRGTLATIASIISAFGVPMLYFRIERELRMRKKEEIVWLPAADWLLVGATLVSLLLVIVPLVTFREVRLPTAASGAAAILVAGYVPAILGHYRIFFGQRRTGPRHNPEPSELFFVTAALIAAVCVFALRLAL
jgi:drug/metabolite transporter (DMT)-like permease